MLKNNAIMITSSVIGLTLMGLCYMLYRKTVNIEKNLISHKHQIDELSRFMSSKSSWINENNIHILYITHDLTTTYNICDDIMVMKNGICVEKGACKEVINHPQEDYTKELISSIPTT